MFLVFCEDVHSFFSSKIVITNKGGEIIKIEPLCREEGDYSYTRNIGWIDAFTIYYDIHSVSLKNEILIQKII